MITIGFDAKRYFLNRTGLGNYSRDLVRILEQYYPDNTYLKYTPRLDDNDLSKKALIEEKIRLPKSTFNRAFPALWRSFGIASDLLNDGVELFHGLTGEIPRGLKARGIKSVVTIHDLIFLRYPELYKPIDRWIYNKKFQLAVNHADKIIAISEQTKSDIIDYYAIPEHKIEVIYQGCHPAFKVPKSDDEQDKLRLKYNLPKDFLLNVGSIEKRKNVLQIVKAIQDIDIPLLIIGKKTTYLEEINRYIVANKLESKVIIKQGFTIEELSTIYAMASIFIYPSIFEGFGIPIIEALYAGTPVITTNSGVFPEAGGPSSCYVDPSNVDEINLAIKRILSDSQTSARMISQGRHYVQKFNDEKIASELINCYQSLL
ncbi:MULTISPECIES: glycosyltransferase family 4 protein [Sphingobacterium]|jgi:glycosyltransferase involved in cell wall biosynthesis|uniref:GDP-mannose-dependent alpha-(1-6)-phosphatidylinositol monomannoside mannosyltransferase n=2 Tax=Sphingobacterium multivorum TaxID=28454 RepID=A0A654A2V0_SPHMU|nr:MULTISPECIES: glycosyltransferase family 1 protein [Sphingobacterium]VXC61933.1 GDP-mannose-dependent alpha-(1-6)-phosphatidylinositol monomannoside mannosyltransferase [Sphingobacterium multivorum]